MRAAARRGYVRSHFSFQVSFLLVVQLTVVASVNAPTSFVSDKGVSVGNSVSNHVQTVLRLLRWLNSEHRLKQKLVLDVQILKLHI